MLLRFNERFSGYRGMSVLPWYVLIGTTVH